MHRYIDKIRVPVRVARLGLPPEPGLLSLSRQAELHDGPETLLERLNAPTHVVPFQLAGDGTVLLLTRTHIEWVEADADVDQRLVHTATWRPTREESVRVRVASGEVFEGILPIEMPDSLNRASDYLNGEIEFFPVRLAGATRLVNKLRVIDVLVHDAAPMPRAA